MVGLNFGMRLSGYGGSQSIKIETPTAPAQLSRAFYFGKSPRLANFK